MKKILYFTWIMLASLAVIFSSCERDGWDEEELYIKGSFKPLENIVGEGGYGSAMLTWELPDSTSTLHLIRVEWEADSVKNHKIFSKSQDTVLITNLEEDDYTFRVISLGKNGEKSSQVVSCFITDLTREPAATIEEISLIVIEDHLFLDWAHPQDENYKGVDFKVYSDDLSWKIDTFVGINESPKLVFKNLDFNGNYTLSCSSINLADSVGESKEYSFTIGDKPSIVLKVPLVSVDTTIVIMDSTDMTNPVIYEFCHNAEIKWTLSSEMDSLLIKFIDMHGDECVYKFGGEIGENKGFLSLLKGGTTEISVQVRGINGVWSLPNEQKIKTKLTDEIGFGTVGRDVHITDLIRMALGERRSGVPLLFQQLANLKKTRLLYAFENLIDLELLVNLEELDLQTNNPSSLEDAPTMSEFRRLTDRLPKLKVFRVKKSWVNSAGLKKEFENDPRIKLILY